MKKIAIFFINKYQKYISPMLDYCGIKCKFYPTCSQYMVEAIEKYGMIKGCFIGIKRIFRCNPLSKGGYDPLK